MEAWWVVSGEWCVGVTYRAGRLDASVVQVLASWLQAPRVNWRRGESLAFPETASGLRRPILAERRAREK
jgi:hypothetical protein